MKKALVGGVLVVGAVVIVATAMASKPGTTRSLTFQVSNNGLLAANGTQVVLSGTYLCTGPFSTTFTITLNVSQGSTASLPPASGTFNCPSVAGGAAWTLIANASTGTYKTGQASAHLSATEDLGGTIQGDAQISLGSSVQGVEVPVAGP